MNNLRIHRQAEHAVTIEGGGALGDEVCAKVEITVTGWNAAQAKAVAEKLEAAVTAAMDAIRPTAGRGMGA